MRNQSLLAVTLAVLAACSSSPDGGNSTGGTTIGATGGTVTSSDGKVQLVIPAGALSKSINFSVIPDTATPTAGSALVAGSVYDFEPSGTTFAVPATIRLSYQLAELPTGSNQLFLSIYHRNGTTWDSIPTTLDTLAHTLTASVSHFSSYGACAGPCQVPFSGYISVGFYPICCTEVPVGGQVEIDGAVEWNGSVPSGAVELGDLPAGITGRATLGPVFPSGCNGLCYAAITVTLFADATAVPLTYNIPVNLVAGGTLIASGHLPLAVVAVPGFTLAASPRLLPLAEGGTAQTTATINRTNFTDPVLLTATGLPAGITASVASPTLTGTTLSSTITFTAANSVPGGDSKVVIHGISGAIEHTDTVTLSVALFSVAAGPPSATVVLGGSTTFGVKVTRATGFSATVALAVTGLPTGVTATFANTSVADSSVLTIAAASGATIGFYSLDITATAGAVTQQAPISVQIAQAGGGLALDFSACSVRPLWVASQDSTAAWTAVTGANGVYQLPTPLTQHVGLALVEPTSAGGFLTSVTYVTPIELSQIASSGALCPVASQSFNGTAAGTDSAGGAFGFISMGGGNTGVRSDGPFTLSAPSGTHDAVGYLERTEGSVSAGDSVLIHRNVTSPGTIDFRTGAPVAVDSALVQGGSAGDFYGVNMFYVSHACEQNELYAVGSTSPIFMITGLPASLQATGDLHALAVNDQSGSSGRLVLTMFHTLADVTVTLGAPISPTVTALTSPYKRLSVSLPSLPSDYTSVLLGGSFGTIGSNQASVRASRNYLGTGSVTITMPDFSSVTGFSSSWEPSPSTTLNTVVQATSAPFTVPYAQQCGEGFTVKSATVTGSN